MIYGVYSIYDKAAGIFTSPTLDISDASACRHFEQAIAQSGSVMNFRPSDFELYLVARFDVESGFLDSVCPLARLMDGSAVVRKVGDPVEV